MLSYKNKIISILLLAVFAVASLPAAVRAESSLDELNQRITSYQMDHIKRANEVRDELKRVHEIETGLAKQYHMPVSEILKYEATLSNLAGIYAAHHYLQEIMNNNNAGLYDDEKLANLVESDPPYNFELYFDLVQHFNYYKNRLETLGNAVSERTQYLEKVAVVKATLEEQFRGLLELCSNATENRVKYKVELIICSYELERCYADTQYVQALLGTYELEISEMKDKITTITPVIAKVRAEIGKAEMDYSAFDDEIAINMGNIIQSMDRLRARYRELEATEHEHVRRSKFERFCVATEKRHIQQEIFASIEVIDLWNGIRLMLRNMGDIIDDDVTHGNRADRNETAKYIKHMEERCSLCMTYIQSQLESVRQAYMDINDINSNTDWLGSQRDIAIRNAFHRELDKRIERYGYARAMFSEVLEYIQIVSHEIDKENNSEGTKEKLNALLIDDFISVLDREIWHVEDYSITIFKVLKAIGIFLIGFIITRMVVFFLRRRFSKKKVRSNLAKLMLYGIFIIGMVVTFIVVLWVLHIPLTAFAFLGGAAAIAVGFGTQKTVGEVIAGLILLIQNRVRVGDRITVDGATGTIDEISLYNTIIRCDETELLVVPNSKIIEAPLLNSTLNNSVIRTEITIGISDTSDIARAKQIIADALDKSEFILKNPPYRILLSDFKEGTAYLLLHIFINVERGVPAVMTCNVRLEVINALLENGIEIAHPCADITVYNAKEDK